jgi:hypothetical protein
MFLRLIDLMLPLMVSCWFFVSAGLVEHGRLLMKFRCMGLRRKTISQAVSFFDMEYAKANRELLPVSDPESAAYSFRDGRIPEEPAQRRQAAFRLAFKVGNNVEWPCTEIENMKGYLQMASRAAKILAIAATGIVLVLPISIVFSFWAVLPGIYLFLLLVCVPSILSGMYRDRATLLNKKGLDDVNCSEGIELKETITHILSFLRKECRWPLVFHLSSDFDGLVYTGRLGTDRGRFELKEAVLYPESE